MQYNYSYAINAFLRRPSNIYSIQLRPREQDVFSKVINPIFTVERRNDASGTPLSALYNAMHARFPTITIASREPRAALITEVLAHVSEAPTIETIQTVLTQQCQRLFGLTIDFTHQADGTVVNKAAIDTLMGISPTDVATSQDYIEAILGMCVQNIWETLQTPPFYSIPGETSVDQRTERLSILTQFFLANLNVYCKARGISIQNFGTVLDASPDLSKDLVDIVAKTLTIGDSVESHIIVFINKHQTSFGLSRLLTSLDEESIQQLFERNYRIVKESPHMDDFIILDKEATGETARCVTHQGAICVNFAEIVSPIAASTNQGYFASIREDFAACPVEIPHENESVADENKLEIETLLTSIGDEKFVLLPQTVKEMCRLHPSPRMHSFFLLFVAKATPDERDLDSIQTEAEALLIANPSSKQTLLRTAGIFTDYSGRTFNCTAYEYAYWAKDTHMCRMLETHMDAETKADMLTRINAIEADGLPFQQNGEEHRSPHFDLTILKTALQAYIDGFDAWYHAIPRNDVALKAAWMLVGKAQRDLPVHIVNEYCNGFNMAPLPRIVTFYNYTHHSNSWFPLVSDSGLGFDVAYGSIYLRGFTFMGVHNGLEIGPNTPDKAAAIDLAMITSLDEVRTADLMSSQVYLRPPEANPPALKRFRYL